MKPQFDHNVKAAFGLWLDNLILRKGQGFTNFTYSLTKIADDRFTDYDVFKSPHAQWVYDSSITGATIPTGITINGGFTPKSSLVLTDYNEGRVFVNKSVGATTAQASYAFKEVNIYFSSVADEKLIFENKFTLNPRTKIIGPASVSEHVYPAIFIKYNAGVNEPACFGGEDKTVVRIRTVIFADSTFIFDGLCGIFRDTVRLCAPYLDSTDIPFGPFGDFKTGISSFNYLNLMHQKTATGQNLMFIRRVSVSPFSEEINHAIGANVVAGFVDFELEILRYPRI